MIIIIMSIVQRFKMKGLLSLFLLPCFISSVLTQCQPWVPMPQEQQDWMPWNWMERFQGHVNNTRYNAANINVLFYGDSITEGWDYMARDTWDRHYGALGAANYGIGGDSTQHVLWRIQNGETDNINLRPRLCVLKIGTNNMGWCSEEDIARGIRTIVEDLRTRLPGMKVLLLGILPRFDAAQTEATERINALAGTVADGSMVRFLNMHDVYWNSATNQLNYELYNGDALHLSTAGYDAWQRAMDPLFQEMWNS